MVAIVRGSTGSAEARKGLPVQRVVAELSDLTFPVGDSEQIPIGVVCVGLCLEKGVFTGPDAIHVVVGVSGDVQLCVLDGEAVAIRVVGERRNSADRVSHVVDAIERVVARASPIAQRIGHGHRPSNRVGEPRCDAADWIGHGDQIA